MTIVSKHIHEYLYYAVATDIYYIHILYIQLGTDIAQSIKSLAPGRF